MKSIIPLLCLVGLTYASTFTLSSSSVSPNTAKSTSSLYEFNFNTVSTFTTDFDLHIVFPTIYTISSVSGCELKINNVAKTGLTCTINTGNNAIEFSDLSITESISSMTVSFTTSTSRYAATDTLIFYYYDPGTTTLLSALTNYVSLTIVNAEMTCSLASNSDIVGEDVTYTVQYTPTVLAEVDSVVQIVLDPWGAFEGSNFLTDNTTNICGGNCSLTLPADTGGVREILKYQNQYSSQNMDGKSLVLSQARNPASTAPISFTVSILAKISSSSLKSYLTCSSTFAVSTASSFSLLSFPTSNKNIGQNNIITLRMGLDDPISSTSYMRITPNGLSLNYQFEQYNQGTIPTEVATSDGTLLLGGLTSSSNAQFLILRNFTLANPPYGNKAVTMTFTTEDLVGSTYYLIDSGTVDIVADPSSITSADLTITDSSLGVTTEYVIWFVSVNSLITSSFIVVTFPSPISILSSTCSLSGIASTCTIDTSTQLTVDLNTFVGGGTNFSLTISNVANPTTTTTTGSISITTYYQDTDTIVDELDSGLTVTANPVTLQSVSLTPSSKVVGATSNYTLGVQVRNGLPVDSSMTIRIPTDSHSATVPVLHEISVDGTPISGCTLTILSSMYLQLGTACFTSQISASSTITMVLGNIANPTSTKQSSSWEIQTFYNSLQMQYLMDGITVTMDTPATLTFFKVTPTSTSANQQNQYSFQLTFLYTHYSGDRIIVTFPDGVLLGVGFACTAVTADATITSCTQSTTETLEVIVSYTGGSSGSGLQFNVTSITNNWFAEAKSFSVQTTTNQTTYYYMQQGTSTVNYQPAALSTTSVSDQNIVLLEQSTISITIAPPFALTRASDQTLLSLTMVVPSDLTPIDGTCSLSYLSASCSLTSQTYTITSFDDFPSSITLTFKASATYFTDTSTFTTTLLYDSSIVAINTDMVVSAFCTSPCKQCTTDPEECVSCLPSPYSNKNFYVSDTSTCVTTCPATYYGDSGQCLSCNSSACYECEGTANNCTSCTGSKNLHNNQCVSTCPSTFYPDNNQCIACGSPCETCTSSTYCLTCISNYFLDVDNTCAITCSDTSYMGLNGVCQKCTNDCLSCEGELSNCTSCDQPTFKLLNNECVQACPSGYYNNINSTCQACVSPCDTCTTAVLCQSCVSGYYLYDGDTCTDVCPPGTLIVVDECQNCSQECATCQDTISKCTQCSTGYYFYLGECRTQCPPLTYPYNKQCTTCIDPCVTCSDSPNLCTSCTENLYLKQSTCVSQCPSAGYYISGSQCLSCVENCLTCQESIVCDTCVDGYYKLDGGCVSSCPDSYPIVGNRECQSCEPQCAGCEGTADNCTTCTVDYFKYSYTCVQQCPIAYYSNILTYECQSNLQAKISFFPVLITMLIITVIVAISKCINPSTSMITALVALFSYLEIAIWIYLIALIGEDNKQPDIDYVLPVVMIIITFTMLVVSNIVFFFVNGSKAANDELVRQWATNNVHFWTLRIVRGMALLFHKFYRLIYSRLFDSLALSLAYKNRSNVFTVATIFSLIALALCEIPIIVASFSLAYNKLLKDQLFYTSVEALVITCISAILTLIDIYKPEEFFEDSEFLRMKKFVEKVRDSSFNKLEEGFDISHEEGSIDGEKFVGLSGGKYTYAKQDPDTLKQFYFEERDQSEITDAMETIDRKKPSKMINIFQPIREEDAQYYEQEKYDETEVYTEVQQVNNEKRQKSLHSDEELDPSNREERKEQMGLDDPFDDKRSLISERGRKRRWNDMMSKRKQLSDKIFNRHPLNLEKIEDQQEDMEEQKVVEKIKRRKKKKKGKANKELEKIYLQRLTEKAVKETIMVSKEEKYDF